MKLNHSVGVPAKIDDVWKFLDNTQAVAECLPGAELTETIDRDNYRGQVKISIGPLTMNYTGDVTVIERNDAEHRMELNASGRDRRGSGTAKASVRLSLEPSGDETHMSVVSDLQLTGRVASLGRGVQDVSNKLFAEFAQNLVAALDGHRASPTTGRQAAAEHSAPLAPAQSAAQAPPVTAGVASDSSLKLGPLIVSVLRERIADFLQSLSTRIRPGK